MRKVLGLATLKMNLVGHTRGPRLSVRRRRRAGGLRLSAPAALSAALHCCAAAVCSAARRPGSTLALCDRLADHHLLLRRDAEVALKGLLFT